MSSQRYPNDHLLVSTDWLAAHLGEDDLRLVEVTAPGSGYVLAHIPGAVHLSLNDILISDVAITADPSRLRAEAPALLGRLGLDLAKPVIVYDEIGGTRAAQVFWALEYLGFEQVSVLEGGIERWLAEGRPTTRKVPPVQPVAFTPALRAERLATADWLAERLPGGTSNSLVVLDCRTPEEFTAGHLPGALNRFWEDNLTRLAYRAFREAGELRAAFSALGAAEDTEVVTYCGVGERSAHTYFTLRLLGFRQPRNYQGSWMEWEARPDLPKA